MANLKVLTAIALTFGIVGLVGSIVIFVLGRGYTPSDYGIVIDAGSSHSRVTLYGWSGSKSNGTGLVKEVTYCESHPGLGKLNVSQVKGSLMPCIEQVLAVSGLSTDEPLPVSLGATAGLRLVNITSPPKVTALLNEVKATLESNSELSAQQVAILSGQDEGLFAWITSNHLMDKLRPRNGGRQTTVGTLDLGGASAQIAYEVYGKTKAPNLANVRLYGIDHTVKTWSNLCYGVDQIRLRLYWLLIRKSQTKRIHENPCMPLNASETIAASELLGDNAPCLKGPSPEDIIMAADDNDYVFTGTSDPNTCSELVSQLLNNTECKLQFDTCFQSETSSLVKSSTLLALSSYYYTESILKLSEMKQISRRDYHEQSFEFCRLDLERAKRAPRVTAKYINTYCFQLLFIEKTLADVYNLQDDWSNVRFTDKVAGQSLGWSLGYMINATNAIPAEAPVEPLLSTTSFVLMLVICSGLIVCGIMFMMKIIDGHRDEFDVYEPIGSEKAPL
ncbi:Ectonucleoside triphosphate diphosphohydrolase 1 [Halotydeus destructor]|nr:Ectonucleoside triphosphate diphosphohydrolase 1 [Halotydeus destructor]